MAPRTPETAATPLQRMRLELGWKAARVVASLAAEAKKRGIVIAEASSLKTMVSRWENGAGQPDSTYQRLFAAVYECDPEDLGFQSQDAVVAARQVAPTMDPETVDYFREVLNQHIRADNLMGPHHLVDVVRAQTQLLDDILPNARDATYDDLLELAFRYNEFAGWLYQDAGDPKTAMLYSDRAMEYATTSGDPINTAYVLMRKANISCDLVGANRAIGLTQAALREAPKVPPRTRALVLGQQARAYALLGDADECQRSIEQAVHEVSQQQASADDISYYCTPSYVDMQVATCWAQLEDPTQAIPVYQAALTSMPKIMRRDRGLCLTQLATAHAVQENKDDACAVGRRAVKAVRSATSARAIGELQRLRQRLAPWRRDEEVSELCREIRKLTTNT